MKVHAECYQCFIGQAIRSARLHKSNRYDLLKPVQSVVKVLQDIDVEVPPPLISEDVYGTIRKTLGIDDPYKQIKKKYNDIALSYQEFMEKEVFNSDNPLLFAIRLALAGNIIDFGSQVGKFDLESTIENTIHNPLDLTDFDRFVVELEKAKNVVLLLDNAGEIVFDKILIKTIKRLYPNVNVSVIVRGGPIINDVTVEDAKYVGLDRVANVVDSGQVIPGFWPETASSLAKEVFNSADVVISKGQGNFETLSEIDDQRVYFLFLVKCNVVARYLGMKKFSKIFIKNDKRWEKQQA